MRKKPTSGLPVVKVSARGIARLKAGHVWVYRSDVSDAAGALPGALVTVTDERGKPFGSALYSSASQIAIRMISNAPVSDLHALLVQRLEQALEYRDRFVEDTDAYRLAFSEADSLPGLIVDRYNDVLSLQVLTQAMDAGDVRETVIAQLRKRFKSSSIVERVDPHIRELEQLPARESQLLTGEKSSTVFTMNGVRFHYDAAVGQKTGAFLDQRENYAAAARYARGEALDVFCYQGGFALHMFPQCKRVTGVDSSRPALEIADQNATLNDREIEWLEANAFDLLKDYSSSGRQYDTIVLDPPAFAKTKKNVETALRGYKELNLRALKMLRPEGVLVTCSCSYHVSEVDFLGLVSEAARDSGKNLRILEKRGQAKDHPVIAAIPETSYLKCLICTISH